MFRCERDKLSNILNYDRNKVITNSLEMVSWMEFADIECWSLELSVPYSGCLGCDTSLAGRYHELKGHNMGLHHHGRLKSWRNKTSHNMAKHRLSRSVVDIPKISIIISVPTDEHALYFKWNINVQFLSCKFCSHSIETGSALKLINIIS